MKLFAAIGLTLVTVAVVSAISLLMAWPFMWLWNGAVVEALTIAKPITYWVSFCLSCFIGLFVRTTSTSSSKS